MKRCLYWIADEPLCGLYINGHKRAEADLAVNFAVLYGRPRLFRKPSEEFLVVDLSSVLIEEIERKLGLGEVPVLAKDGTPLPDARKTMQERARSFESFGQAGDPVREAAQALELAREALNAAAVAGALTSGAAEARDLCAKAGRLLEENRRITPEAAAAIRQAGAALSEVISADPVHHHLRVSEADVNVHRAVRLADLHGEQHRSREPESASGDENRESQLRDLAATRRRSRAFDRGL